MRELGIFLRILGKRGFGAYIVVSSEPRSLKSGDFSLRGKSIIRVSEILGCLSIWGRYGWVLRFLCVMHKMFPYMRIREDQARPRRTLKLLHSIGLMVTCHFRFSYWFVREMCLSAFAVASSIESIVSLSRVFTSIIVIPEPPSSFYEADNFIGVVYSPSLLLISFNYFVENTPIRCPLLRGSVGCSWRALE